MDTLREYKGARRTRHMEAPNESNVKVCVPSSYQVTERVAGFQRRCLIEYLEAETHVASKRCKFSGFLYPFCFYSIRSGKD